MMRRLLLLLLIALIAGMSHAGEFVLDVSLSHGRSGFQSFASYIYHLGPSPPTAFSQYHTIVNTSAEHSSSVFTEQWSNNLNARDWPQPPLCYTGRLTVGVATGPFWNREWSEESKGTEQLCFQGPPEPELPPEDTCATVPCSPIVVNLETAAYVLSGADDAVYFDIDADGITNRITWTARDNTVAFLANDRNGNLRIDNGSELFGNSTLLNTGSRAANGFEALKELDGNGDGVINAEDVSWSDAPVVDGLES